MYNTKASVRQRGWGGGEGGEAHTRLRAHLHLAPRCVAAYLDSVVPLEPPNAVLRLVIPLFAPPVAPVAPVASPPPLPRPPPEAPLPARKPVLGPHPELHHLKGPVHHLRIRATHQNEP